MTLHPLPDEDGKPVVLKSPSEPSPLEFWSLTAKVACVVPGGLVPPTLNGVPLAPWTPPAAPEAWESLAAETPIIEPPFQAPGGLKKAAGVVTVEPDGRVWVVAPSNGFGGYKATFPKGGLEGRSAQAAALVEAWEESGLQVRLVAHLIDVKRTQSFTRYYLARRVGGSPADMGWESQAVMLVPQELLGSVLSNANDKPIIEALIAYGR